MTEIELLQLILDELRKLTAEKAAAQATEIVIYENKLKKL